MPDRTEPVSPAFPAHPAAPPNGRRALVTGANTGIGAVTAVELARAGCHVLLACRSQQRTQPVLDQITALCGPGRAEWVALDLGDFASVQRCAQAVLAHDQPLHLLVNNAGLAGARGLTPSGFELAFGVNHMGHFLLTQLLLERLRRSAPARIVTVASRAHRLVRGMHWHSLQQPTRTWLMVREYGQSKLANILFSAELGRRLHGSGVTTYAVHPGVVASDLWCHVPAPLRLLLRERGVPVQAGAATTLHCALSPDVARETGLYYSDCRPRLPSAAAQSTAAAAVLWQRSQAWVDAWLATQRGAEPAPTPA